MDCNVCINDKDRGEIG